jgi:hypothetical protein
MVLDREKQGIKESRNRSAKRPDAQRDTQNP